MTPTTVFLLKESNPTNPNIEPLLKVAQRITPKVMFEISDTMEWEQGKRFILFCRKEQLLTDKRVPFVHRYHIVPHTIARKHPTAEPVDYIGKAQRLIDVFTRRV